jgi:hypothetical protein
LVAQHWGVPLAQTGSWRSWIELMAGAATAAAAKARIMENCILKDVVFVGGWKVEVLKLVVVEWKLFE